MPNIAMHGFHAHTLTCLLLWLILLNSSVAVITQLEDGEVMNDAKTVVLEMVC